MTSYIELSMRLFKGLSERLVPYFDDLKLDLKKARMKITLQEYLSTALLTCSLIFLIEFPILSFIFGLVFQSFLFSFISSLTVSIFLTAIFFLFYIKYPKFTIRDRIKSLDNALPFSVLFLSTLSGSKLPLHNVFEMFSKFASYGEISKEIDSINYDTEVLGMDVNTAIERAIARTPSKKFKELLWGILSTNRAGGDLNIYLKERARHLMVEYRRKLTQFSQQLTIFIEIYLTAIVIGAVFFTILTAIMSGIAAGIDIIVLQFFVIFVFLPLLSALFIIILKSITPGGE